MNDLWNQTGSSDLTHEQAAEAAELREGAAQLKADFDAVSDAMRHEHLVRLHRAIRWYQCAVNHAENDHDVSFIALWVGLNACYARRDYDKDTKEWQKFKGFAENLVKLDQQKRIRKCLMGNPEFVLGLVESKWLYGPFWRLEPPGKGFRESWFQDSYAPAKRAILSGGEPADAVLEAVLDRLYVLRNQLLHGGATHDSSLNRELVASGKSMLMELLPIIIRLMFDPSQNWGPIEYPPQGSSP